MQVTMSQRVNGAYGTLHPGEVADLPPEVAAAWIAAGIATAVTAQPERVEASQPAAETAAIEPPSHAAFSRQARTRKR